MVFKRIEFVPAKDTTAGGSIYESSTRPASAPPQEQLSAGDRYLSLVLGPGQDNDRTTATGPQRANSSERGLPRSLGRVPSKSTRSSPGLDLVREGYIRLMRDIEQPVMSLPEDHGGLPRVSQTNAGLICEVCNRPIPDTSVSSIRKHEASFVHQVSLPHSHPPSSIDRTRRGYKYLQSFGWDPDSRQGLGSAGQGIREPLKARAKNDTVGLGIDVKRLKKEGKVVKKKEKRLNAKEVRQMEKSDKKKSERLRRMFYANDEVEKHLGNHGS
ncbi:Actin- protein 6 [Ascosphaera pollenicola]|nr:Actin- protein 6 [Ascosphaera pollenicola]